MLPAFKQQRQRRKAARPPWTVQNTGSDSLRLLSPGLVTVIRWTDHTFD